MQGNSCRGSASKTLCERTCHRCPSFTINRAVGLVSPFDPPCSQRRHPPPQHHQPLPCSCRPFSTSLPTFFPCAVFSLCFENKLRALKFFDSLEFRGNLLLCFLSHCGLRWPCVLEGHIASQGFDSHNRRPKDHSSIQYLHISPREMLVLKGGAPGGKGPPDLKQSPRP